MHVLIFVSRQHAQAQDFSEGPVQGVHHSHTGLPFSIAFSTLTFEQVHHKIFLPALLIFSQTGEKTALYCLTQHDWKLDIALDNYFANPEAYYR